jgi:uroporphyrin-III C-methyltransferase/precorrin-2 dehydrogenase/sirohydrochlorin ferrochelatase
VIAPQIDPSIPGRVEAVLTREFVAADLDGACWVVAAATPEVNRAVADAARARGLFVNAVDDKDSATAYLGGVIRRGEIEIAISTGGTAPALAGLLREGLEAMLPDELDRWIEVALAARAEWKAAKVPMAARRPMLLRALEELYSPGQPHRASPHALEGPPRDVGADAAPLRKGTS